MPPRTRSTSSSSDVAEMHYLFKFGDHGHLRALLTALLVDPTHRGAVIEVFKRKVLPYMGDPDIRNRNILHQVERLSERWRVEVNRKPLEDAPFWKDSLASVTLIEMSLHTSSGASEENEEQASPSSPNKDSVQRFFEDSVTSKEKQIDETASRPSKKRKYSVAKDSPAQKPRPSGIPSPTCMASRPSLSKKPVPCSPAQKVEEKMIPLVLPPVMREGEPIRVVEASFFHDYSFSSESEDERPPHRPQNPMATTLSDRNPTPLGTTTLKERTSAEGPADRKNRQSRMKAAAPRASVPTPHHTSPRVVVPAK